MPKKLTIAEEVAARVRRTRYGYASWVDKLPDDLKPEFLAVLEQYDPSRFQQASYARAVVEVCREHKIPSPPSHDTVCRWLRQKNQKQ